MINSVLAGAVDWNIVAIVIELIPLVFFIIGALVGFAKGFRKLSWADEAWLLAVGLYSGILEILQTTLGDTLNPAVPVVVAAVICAAVSVLVFTVFRLIVQPKERKIDNKELQKILRREDEFREIEEEEIEELLEEYPGDARRLRRLEKKQKQRREEYLERMDGNPRFSSRLIGAAVLGTCLVLIGGMVMDAIVYIASCTPLATGVLSDLFALERMQKMLATIDPKVLDYILIGILMCAVYRGYEKGALTSIYSFITAIASLAATVFSFYLPFSPLAGEGGLFAFVGGMSASFTGSIETALADVLPIALPEGVLPVVGKIASGLVVCLVMQIVVAIFLALMRKVISMTEEVRIVGALDGILGVVLEILIWILVLAVILFALQILEAIGWYSASTALFADTGLFSVCYEELGNLVAPWIEKIVGFLPL